MYVYNIIHTIGTIIQSPVNFTYLPNLTVLPIELVCDITPVAGWLVNNSRYFLSDLMNEMPSEHNRNGTNILIITPMNNTKYRCSNGINLGELSYIFVAGKYKNCKYT